MGSIISKIVDVVCRVLLNRVGQGTHTDQELIRDDTKVILNQLGVIQDNIRDVHTTVQKTTAAGRPMVYFAESAENNQVIMIQLLRDITHTLKDIVRTQERILDKLL